MHHKSALRTKNLINENFGFQAFKFSFLTFRNTIKYSPKQRLNPMLLRGRVINKDAWVAALLGTHLRVQDFKKVNFLCEGYSTFGI